jgi:hypothetical protein
MAHVYGHADCTIAYLFPPQDALTKPRQDPRILSSCVLRPPSAGLPGVYIRPNMDDEIYRSNLYDKTIPDIDWLAPKDWPLFTRAWACQEYLLSPRIVFVGHRNLMWECSELLCDELLGPIKRFPRTTASKIHFSAVRSVKLPITTMDAQLKVVQDWARLVRHYRAGMLTQPEDRFMAFAGVAQAVHDSSGMTYLRGSWAQLFPFSFTWSLNFKRGLTELPDFLRYKDENSTMTEVEAAIEWLPSWSWFSVPIFSHDAFEFEVNDRMLKILRRSDSKTIIPMSQAILISYEDKLDEFQHAHPKSQSTTAFRHSLRMTLNIYMKTLNGFLEWSSKSNLRLGQSKIKDQFDTLLGRGGSLRCQFDRQDMAHNLSDRWMTFGLLIELRTGHEPGMGEGFGEPFLVGLIMQPDYSRKLYKRIGLWTLYLFRYPQGWDAEKFKSVSLFDQLQGVRSEHIRLV